jgi:hypothetical protein
MFRLASLLGVACFALAACALAGRPTNAGKRLPADQNSDESQNQKWGSLVRFPAQRFHARFSVN